MKQVPVLTKYVDVVSISRVYSFNIMPAGHPLTSLPSLRSTPGPQPGALKLVP